MRNIRTCEKCGANNIQANKNIVLILFDGNVRQYECNVCGNIWTVTLEEENKCQNNS